MSTYNIYLALVAQLDKLARHNRQGSFQTKRRYYEAMKRFCRFHAGSLRTCDGQYEAGEFGADGAVKHKGKRFFKK